ALPAAAGGTPLKPPLDEERVPASADHTFCTWSGRARWPRLLDAVPPGSVHAAFVWGGGSWTGRAAAFGWMAARVGSVMTAMRSPRSLSFSFLNGFLMPASGPLQATTLKAVAAITPAP